MPRAIQFLGTQRSGSNLLRLILNQHSSISAPHPPHLLKTFFPLLPHFFSEGSLRLYELVEDMCSWVECNPVPWTDVVLDRKIIVEGSRDIFDVFQHIYEAKARADNAAIWCCKSTFNIEHVDDLERTIKPFYIYLYRDGRDVAVSFKNAIVGPKHVFNIAEKWSHEQEMSLDFLTTIPDDRKAKLSYEDLIDHPERSVMDLCAKLGLDFQPDMLQYYTSEESLHTAESGRMWANVIKPVMPENHDKFPKELTPEEIRIFEQVAGNTLLKLGYPLSSQAGEPVELDVATYNRINEELKEKARRSAPREDLARRAAQEKLFQDIQERLKVLV